MSDQGAPRGPAAVKVTHINRAEVLSCYGELMRLQAALDERRQTLHALDAAAEEVRVT